MTTALIAVPLWILVFISGWSVLRTIKQERAQRREMEEATALMRESQEIMRRSAPVTRVFDRETLH